MFWQKKRVFASKNTTATCPRSRCAKTQTAAGYVTDVETLNHSPPRPPPPPPFLSSNNEGGEEEGGDCRAADHQCRDFTPLCALHYSAWRRAARQNSSATWRCFPAGEQAHCISEPTGRLQVLKWHERGSLKERGRETEKGGEGERERSQTSFGSEFSLRGMNSSTDINALKCTETQHDACLLWNDNQIYIYFFVVVDLVDSITTAVSWPVSLWNNIFMCWIYRFFCLVVQHATPPPPPPLHSI